MTVNPDRSVPLPLVCCKYLIISWKIKQLQHVTEILLIVIDKTHS